MFEEVVNYLKAMGYMKGDEIRPLPPPSSLNQHPVDKFVEITGEEAFKLLTLAHRKRLWVQYVPETHLSEVVIEVKEDVLTVTGARCTEEIRNIKAVNIEKEVLKYYIYCELDKIVEEVPPPNLNQF